MLHLIEIKVEFAWWIINSEDEWDFSKIKNSKISKLSLCNSGAFEYSDWNSNPLKFENIIKGISNSESLTKNIRLINLFRCGISVEKIKEVQTKYGIPKIRTFQ